MSQNNRAMKLAIGLAVAGFLVLVAGVLGWWFTGGPGAGSLQMTGEAGIGQAAIGGPFELVDQHGETRTEKDLLGHYTLVFFGYTFCPDVCPTSLLNITQALDLLAESAPDKAEQVVPVFVTVDPQRDTPEAMAAYVSNFHPAMIGLTGTPEQVAGAVRTYKAFYRKVESEPGDDDYLMDHSSFIYLMDPEGRYLTHFSHQTPPAEMQEKLAQFVKG